MKKNKFLLVMASLPVILFSLSNCGNRLKGANAFMFKMTGNAFGEAILTGFSEVMSNNNEKYFDKSPSEANVGAQVQMIETLTMQQVKSITVSASGTTGYDEVLKRSVEKGVKIISTDSPISPSYRITHVEHTRTQEVGTWLARAATLIALGINYQDPDINPDWDNSKLLEQPVIDALDERIKSGKTDEIKFGIVSSTQDSPSQNEWIKYIEEELQSSELSKKYEAAHINQKPEIKYGDDETKKSKDMAEYFIGKNVNVIIAPTTVAMAACATCIQDRINHDPNCNVKLTGLGMPSECWGAMPKNKDDTKEDVSYICPYMMLWDVIELGKVSAKAAIEAANNNWDGKKVGESFQFDPDGKGLKTYTTEEADDGGTKIVALKPLPFTRFNIEYWKEIL